MVPRKSLFRRALAIWPLIVVLAASLFGTLAFPYFATSKNLGVQKHPLINQLMYPSFGNPAIVKKGTDLVVEFDPRNRDFKQPFVPVKSFSARARTSADPYPVTVGLHVSEAKPGASTRWPEYAGRAGADMRVYQVTVQVPTTLAADLYDLTVIGKLPDGKTMTDTQPHSLSAVDAFKDDFSFVQMTDIHMYGPELNYSFANYHLRYNRQTSLDPSRKGAVYYDREIDQINTVKPDFCVFTGDFMYGQSYLLQDQGRPWGLTTEYQYEMLWFYQQTMRLDVPVFTTIGNHDSFAEGPDPGAHEDWFDNWRRIFGPLYHSFDYGDYHFLALNSQDWPLSKRVLADLNVSIQSEKYKGQYSGGGDKWAPGVDLKRIQAIDDSKLTGQLAWIRDDLAAHQGSKLRVVAAHQDPWRNQGTGMMWASQLAPSEGFLSGIKSTLGFAGYGDGAGRLAAIKLFSEYRVNLELSGHLHSDYVETMPWLDGRGQMISVNTTCSQFAVAGVSNSYPGYRLVQVRNGKVAAYNYAEPKWAVPFYAGTHVGGITDLGKLATPAIETLLAGGPGGGATLMIKNHLDKPLVGAFGKMVVPYLSGGRYYTISGGRIEAAHDSSADDPTRLVYYVRTDVAPGETRVVNLTPSKMPDKTPPSGGVSINGGAASTASTSVGLTLPASDGQGPGVKDMMISNSADFKGGSWQSYQLLAGWTLAGGATGPRTVYVRFRDFAMPPNVSAAGQAAITVTP
jgi:3',5'-cyclic AMP phosphodiesterase CpdA